MLVLSSKVRYGSAALMELVGNYDQGLLPSKVIAERRGIPPNYLEQLLNRLTKGGLIKASRGSKGGYQLALPPGEVTFLQVWEMLEGGLETKNDVSQGDAVQDLYLEAELAVKKGFSISLAELFARQQKYEEPAQENMMFHI